LILLLLCAACGPPAGPLDPGPEEPEPSSDPDIVLTAEIGEAMPTVVFVRVETEGADSVSVQYGIGGELDHQVAADLDEGGAWEATVLGLAQQQQISLQAVVERNGEVFSGELEAITTGVLPVALPTLTIEQFSSEPPGRGFMVTSLSAGPVAAAVILDADGQYVWAHPVDEPYKLTHSWLSVDRQWVYVLVSGAGTAIGITRVRLDGTAVEEVGSVEAWHHDAVDRPDGTLDFLAYDERQVGDDWVTGDRIVSLVPGSEPEITWSIWDHCEPPVIHGEADRDWSHANAIVYDDSERLWYLSLFSLDEIVAVDEVSGEILWTFGGVASDLTLPAGEHEGFHHQHGFQLLGDHVLLFDNGEPEQYASRVEEYALDFDGRTAELVWQYEPDPALYNLVLGDVERLDDGNTLVCFSNAGQVDLVDPAGDLLWRLSTPIMGTFWYMQWVGSLYP